MYKMVGWELGQYKELTLLINDACDLAKYRKMCVGVAAQRPLSCLVSSNEEFIGASSAQQTNRLWQLAVPVVYIIDP